MSQKIIIIGNGVSGVSCALSLQKQDHSLDITIISAESQYYYSRPALMYIFMGHMRFKDTMPYPKSFWKKQKIKLVQGLVTEVDTEKSEIKLENKKSLKYDSLIVASGSKPNMFSWPGVNLNGVQGLYSLQDLELLEKNIKKAKKAAIVGGGLIGIELAEMLHSRGLDVTFLVRESSYWNRILLSEESEMVNQAIRKEGIKLMLSTTLKEILGNDREDCEAVLTEEGQRIDADIVGITIGVKPNIDFLQNSNIKTNRGIIVDEFFRSSVENVYAIGDCAEISEGTDKTRVEQLWYTGKMQGDQLAKNITLGNGQYDKGIFYNSAKFFNIEYQIYGDVPQVSEGDQHLVWQSKDKGKLLRVVFRDDKLIGLNVMGMRYRHRVCEDWIRKEVNYEYLVANLRAANFDPEFYSRYEKTMVAAFNSSRES